jgi:hypothetical protein
MVTRFKYSKEHLEFLRSGYMEMSVTSLTKAFNDEFQLDKTEGAIKGCLRINDIKCGRGFGDLMKGKPKTFTFEHIQWFKDNYPNMTRQVLTEQFNQVFGENRKVDQVAAFIKRNGIKSGRNQYEKGFQNPLKGTTGRKVTSGCFKAGHKTHNWLAVGSERTVIGGYIEVKTAEPNVWVGKHRLNWIAANGEIPKDHFIRFKDSDTGNCALDNLFLVSRAESMRVTQLGFSQLPPEYREAGILVARVEAKADQRRQ